MIFVIVAGRDFIDAADSSTKDEWRDFDDGQNSTLRSSLFGGIYCGFKFWSSCDDGTVHVGASSLSSFVQCAMVMAPKSGQNG